jgi:hypothetical protein
MKVGIVICGTNDWKEYSFPLIDSIFKYTDKKQIEICAMGTVTPPPDADNYHDFPVSFGWSTMVDGYARAINFGLISLMYDKFGEVKYFDWYLIMNNDVLCEAPFINYLEKLDPKTVYGNTIHT